MALFDNGDEEKQAIVVGAAVALHALIARHDDTVTIVHQHLVSEAFAIAEEFWRQAKSRFDP